MNLNRSTTPLPQLWLKAAMLGSLWASVEIVLGSFLHNIHMPLSGTFLAALGVIMMINGYKLWPEQGLFWRTALVTALMKSISPSAIILGPMVGIFMEGVILEATVRLFRRRWIGFILGGALAVSWSLFQKIFVMLMTYGPDFVVLYEQLYFMAAKTLQIHGPAPFDLVKFIFILDLGFGAAVAAVAWSSRSGRSQQRQVLEKNVPPHHSGNLLTASVTQAYSLPLLGVNLALLLLGLNFLDDLPQLWALIATLVYVGLNILRYARSLKRLKRPQLWIQLMALMALSGLILGGWQDLNTILHGLLTGLSMATRALLVIFSFSALSIELRNPKVIDWFNRRGMGVMFDAVSLAFEVLPHMLKMVSLQDRVWRHPFKTLLHLLGSLEELRLQHLPPAAKVLLITGDQGSGKTTLLQALLRMEAVQRFDIQGILTLGTWGAANRDHYHVMDIKTGEQALLCDRLAPTEIKAGPFFFLEEGFALGRMSLNKALLSEPDLVIIDEVGHLELSGQGWASAMDELVGRGQSMIWSVRPALLDEIAARWHISYTLFSAASSSTEELTGVVQQLLRST